MRVIRSRPPSGARLSVSVAALLVALLAMAGSEAWAREFSKQQALVDKARLTLEAFTANSSLKDALRDLGPEARALFIVPQFLRGAFIFGGAGGSGVLLARDEKTGKWGDPVFYNIGSASFGLQVGADVSEIVLVVRTSKGLQEFYSNDFKLGANVGIAAGPVGAGVSAKGIAADIIAYARQKGVFVGIAVDGALVSVSDASNKAYYGKAVRPTDILVTKEIGNPRSIPLRNAAEHLMR